MVVGVDNADRLLRLANDVVKGKDAAWIVDARNEDAVDIVTRIGQEDGKRESGEMGLDVVLILTESQKAFGYSMSLLKNHGRCVVIGVFP
jgi:D-arabinose 1-dehydrogenase-like Zn-dependent alcohol dehydrogenase